MSSAAMGITAPARTNIGISSTVYCMQYSPPSYIVPVAMSYHSPSGSHMERSARPVTVSAGRATAATIISSPNMCCSLYE